LDAIRAQNYDIGVFVKLMGIFTLLGLCQLVGASLLKINHSVITHFIAEAMFTQYPTSKPNAQFLHHFFSK
jgi:hypothetical protein